jgi:hypothetical protein
LCLFGQPGLVSGRSCMNELKSQGKSFEISKREVWRPFRR